MTVKGSLQRLGLQLLFLGIAAANAAYAAQPRLAYPFLAFGRGYGTAAGGAVYQQSTAAGELSENSPSGGIAPPQLSRAANGDLIANFLVVGDWGRRGEFNQSEVADAMARVASHVKPDFILSTGDHFYNCGLSSTEDEQFKTSFSEVYSDSTLQVPWYGVLGNHDYSDNMERCPGVAPECWQLDAQDCSGNAACCFSPLHQLGPGLTQRDWRWNVQRRFTVSLGVRDADIFFIDTSPFIEHYRNTSWARVPGGLLFQSWAAQLAELETELAKSSAVWKLLVGHHPVLSNGAHGNALELEAHLRPLLAKHGVQAYFCGHDHDLQMLGGSDGVQYIVSGAGSKTRQERVERQPSKFQHNGSGFVSVSLHTGKADLSFYGIESDRPLYTATVQS